MNRHGVAKDSPALARVRTSPRLDASPVTEAGRSVM
jgi:hypothetical protein